LDLKTTIGNSGKTPKGGAGLGLYYIESLNQEDIGQGLFGYSKQFKGLGVFLNSVL
jgi:hypothetical protein